MRLKPLSLAIHCFFVGTSVFIQVQANEIAHELGEIVVWGTQINSSAIFSEDIEIKQADHLSDLLRSEPGIDIGGSHSMNQGINIRSVSELDLEITIDGASQTNNVFHHVGNLLINPDILQVVDLKIGNNSILHSGLGGGIAFETKNAQDLLLDDQQFGGRLYSGFASNDYINYSATAYGMFAKFDLLAYYSGIDRENPKDPDGVEQIGREGTTNNYLLKFGWNPNENNRLELSYDYYNDTGEYSLKSNMGAGTADHDSNIRPIEYQRDTLALNYDLYFGESTLNATLYRNEMRYENTAPNTNEVGEGNVEVYGFKALTETPITLANKTHLLRYGIEGKKEESKKLLNGEIATNKAGQSSIEKADSYSVYLEDEIQLTNALMLTPGVRYNYYQPTMLASNDTFTDTLFALAAEYAITTDWTLAVSATELFKGPALSGSYLASNSSFNPNLKAETGINLEASIAYQTKNLLGIELFESSLTLFQTKIDDYIDDVMTGKATATAPYRNLGDVEINGFEAVIGASQGNLRGRLTYSRSDSRFIKVNDNSGYALGQAVDDEVGDSLSLTLGYELPSLKTSINWTSQWVMDLEKNVAEDTFKEGYNTHDISVRWQAINNLHLTASVENIFDEKYSSHASHALGTLDIEPGRNFKISAAYTF